MNELDLDEIIFLAKYPFLSEAKEYVMALNLTLDSMTKHPVYSVSLEHGKRRAIDAIEGKFKSEVTDKITAEFALLSYVVSRILVSATKNKRILEKYARGEAKALYPLLKSETPENLTRIMDDVTFNVGEDKRIPFELYLHLSKNIIKETRNPKWKLVNRDIKVGRVRIYSREIPLLLTEKIRDKINEPAPLNKIPTEFFTIAKNMATILNPRDEIKTEEIEDYALSPCIKKLMNALTIGQMSHNGMFILATFLIGLGLNKEKILTIFSAFPNFVEEKTRYQIEFLSGEKSTVKYTCPGCEKIKFYGLCPEDCGVTHPIKYYMRHSRKRRRRSTPYNKSNKASRPKEHPPNRV